MVNLYVIVYCAITCYILGVKFFTRKFKYNYNNVQYIMINGNIFVARGGVERRNALRGERVSKTSGESVGKGI